MNEHEEVEDSECEAIGVGGRHSDEFYEEPGEMCSWCGMRSKVKKEEKK